MYNVTMPSPEKTPQTHKRFLAGLLLVLITVAAYAPAVRGGFIWDDDQYLTDNPLLDDGAGLWRIWSRLTATPQYYPMVFTSFWIEKHLWGLNPMGYHLVNVLLHALSAVLLWTILGRLNVAGAWFAAAVFALHPVNVESVAWITERKNVLSGILMLSALLLYHRFHPPGEDRREKNYRYYAAAFLAYAGALLSKSVTSVLPVFIILIIYWKRGRIKPADLLPLLPFLAAGAAAGSVTSWIERHHVGAAGEPWSFTIVERILIAGKAFWFYAAKIILPVKLSFVYPRWTAIAADWTWYLFPPAVLAAYASLWAARGRIGRGPLAAALAFAAGIFPAVGFFNVFPQRYALVADHFLYLGGIGLIVPAASLLWKAAAAGPRGALSKRTGLSLAHFVLLGHILPLLAALTWRQGLIYRDQETLWRDTIKKNPAAWLAHTNLGNFLTDSGREAEARRHLLTALELEPGYPEAYCGLGVLAMRSGRMDEALRYFSRALELRPTYFPALINQANTLSELGKIREAVAALKAAVAQSPDSPLAHNNLGIQYAKLGDLEAAESEFRAALKLDPRLVMAHQNLAKALTIMNKPGEAARHAAEAARMSSGRPQAR